MNVLIAVDDLDFGAALAEFAGHHQWPPHTRFRIVNVVEPILLGHSSEVAFLELLENRSEEVLKDAAKLVRHTALMLRDALKSEHVEEVVLEGHAKETIVDMASQWPADFVIIGSHGRRGLSRFILGSVSMAVVSHAPCSVVVLRLPTSQSASVQAGEAES